MFLTPREYRIGLQCGRKLWYSKQQHAKRQRTDLGYCKREFRRQVRCELLGMFDRRDLVRNPRLLWNRTVGKGDLLLPSGEDGWVYCAAYPTYKLKEKLRESVLFSVNVFLAGGLFIEKIHVYLLNPAYREDTIRSDIFRVYVLDPPLKAEQREFEERTAEFLSLLQEPEPPPPAEGCRRRCRYRNLCRPGNIRDPFYPLQLSPAQKERLRRNGIHKRLDIPPDYPLGRKQRIQADTLAKAEVHVEADKLARFLEDVRYPLSFMDFESVSLPVPPYLGMKPWEPYPYLYALDVRTAGGTAFRKRKDFFVEDCRDGREDFVCSLLSQLPPSGTILVFDATSERKILSSLARYFPCFRDEIDRIIHRIKDLYRPFEEYHYYHPRQEGKLSLKMLFSLISVQDDQDYESLEVRSGLGASAQYIRYRNLVCRCINPAALDDFRLKIVRYCRQDSGAAAAVFDHLIRTVSEIYPEYLVFSPPEE